MGFNLVCGGGGVERRAGACVRASERASVRVYHRNRMTRGLPGADAGDEEVDEGEQRECAMEQKQ